MRETQEGAVQRAKMAKYKQDMPPAGGYGPIEWAKKVKGRGWGGKHVEHIFSQN